VTADGPLGFRAGKNQPTAGALAGKHAVGEFTPAVRAALAADPALVGRIARDLLDAHFPASIHPDILAAVGLDPEVAATVHRRPRDPRFREAVLTAYGYRCAVCGQGLRLGPQAVALDAAHIRWHAAGGPDDVINGLCLCVLHHKLFDLGAFTVEARTGAVRVSDRVNGDGADRALLAHAGAAVGRPRRADWHPADGFLGWHANQVFHRM
jgi:putative restriction endonuclease